MQGEDGRSAVRRTHRFVLPRRMCGGSGITRECSTSSTAFCTQFRTTSWSFCPSVRPSPLEEEVGLGTREPCKGAAVAITIRPPRRSGFEDLRRTPGENAGQQRLHSYLQLNLQTLPLTLTLAFILCRVPPNFTLNLHCVAG